MTQDKQHVRSKKKNIKAERSKNNNKKMDGIMIVNGWHLLMVTENNISATTNVDVEI